MTIFTVGHIRDNSGHNIIGYKVTSTTIGGVRVHFTRLGGDRARSECERYAAALQAEADAAGDARGAASRAAAALLNEFEADRLARRAARAEREATQPRWRA